jgi:hypothetical protein
MSYSEERRMPDRQQQVRTRHFPPTPSPTGTRTSCMSLERWTP